MARKESGMYRVVLTMRKAAVCSAVFWIGASFVALGADKSKLPDGPGKETTQRICGSCHAAEIFISRRESRDGWNGIVADMIQRGMKGSDEEFGEVVDYLVANFSKSAPPAKINVNKATAKTLASGLGISDEQAAAIVQHREAKGDFKTIADLQKVPGLDAAAIEAKKSRLEF